MRAECEIPGEIRGAIRFLQFCQASPKGRQWFSTIFRVYAILPSLSLSLSLSLSILLLFPSSFEKKLYRVFSRYSQATYPNARSARRTRTRDRRGATSRPASFARIPSSRKVGCGCAQVGCSFRRFLHAHQDPRSPLFTECRECSFASSVWETVREFNARWAPFSLSGAKFSSWFLALRVARNDSPAREPMNNKPAVPFRATRSRNVA